MRSGGVLWAVAGRLARLAAERADLRILELHIAPWPRHPHRVIARLAEPPGLPRALLDLSVGVDVSAEHPDSVPRGTRLAKCGGSAIMGSMATTRQLEATDAPAVGSHAGRFPCADGPSLNGPSVFSWR